MFQRISNKTKQYCIFIVHKGVDINPKTKTKSVQSIRNQYPSTTKPKIIKVDDKKDKTKLNQVIMVPTK